MYSHVITFFSMRSGARTEEEKTIEYFHLKKSYTNRNDPTLFSEIKIKK